MNETGICTDSSALLPADVADRFGVEIVPIAIALDGRPFDERAHTLEHFYQRLDRGVEVTTSQPSPGDFADAYAALAARGARTVLSIHLDARVSGTGTAAELAAREAPIPVRVVDTKTVSFGVAACVREAAAAIEAGASTDAGATAATRLGAAMRNAFVARSAPGGRVPGPPGWAVLTFVDGATQPIAACRSAEEASEVMAERVRASEEPFRAAVGHAGTLVEREADVLADVLADALADSPQAVEIERYRVGAPVGAHTGGSSFGVFWWPIVS
ncbi:DegV family protein [soil metagenome]